MPSADFDVVTGPPVPSRPLAPAAGSVKPPAREVDPTAVLSRAPIAPAEAGGGERQ